MTGISNILGSFNTDLEEAWNERNTLAPNVLTSYDKAEMAKCNDYLAWYQSGRIQRAFLWRQGWTFLFHILGKRNVKLLLKVAHFLNTLKRSSWRIDFLEKADCVLLSSGWKLLLVQNRNYPCSSDYAVDSQKSMKREFMKFVMPLH